MEMHIPESKSTCIQTQPFKLHTYITTFFFAEISLFRLLFLSYIWYFPRLSRSLSPPSRWTASPEACLCCSSSVGTHFFGTIHTFSCTLVVVIFVFVCIFYFVALRIVYLGIELRISLKNAIFIQVSDISARKMEERCEAGRKVTIGVCVMEKKVKSSSEVLSRSCSRIRTHTIHLHI